MVIKAKLWKFAGIALRYRGALAGSLGGALLNAACAAGGIGTLLWLFHQVFSEDATAYALLRDKLTSPKVQGWIGDWTGVLAYVPQGEFGGFAFLVVLIGVIATVGAVGRFVHEYLGALVLNSTTRDIRMLAFGRLVRLEMEAATATGSADRMSRVLRDLRSIRQGLSRIMDKAVRHVLQGAVMLIWALALDWRLAAMFLVPGPLLFLLIYRLGRRIKAMTKQTYEHAVPLVAAVQRVLKALRVVKVHHAEDVEERQFRDINERLHARQMGLEVYRALSSPIAELLAIWMLLVLMIGAAWYVYESGGAKPAEMLLVIGLLGGAAGTLRPLTDLNNSLQSAEAAAERVDELLNLPIEDYDRDQSQPRLPRHEQSVVFDRVTYTYPGREVPAVRDVRLEVPHGSLCAVVGPNGSGKTTLLGLVPRLYPPDTGRVLIDGRDIAEHNLASIRRQMAVITQETVLFEGTVAENIAYGLDDVSRDEVIAAAKRAHADGFVERLPRGYDTQVGEDGVWLSGGQRQRIAIARAVLRKPAVLILDEATSEIDAESETRIIEALAEVTRDCTTFVIAHRLSTIAHADMVVVMHDGEVAGVGTHEGLLETSELYRGLSRDQLIGEAPREVLRE